MLKSIRDLLLPEVEAIRLILRGGSVVDWHRLQFTSSTEIERFLATQELSLENPSDRAYLDHVREEAIEYLRRNFSFSIPKPIERAPVDQLMLIASGQAESNHRQLCACTVLKTLHIIHHMSGRELLFRLPVSDHDLFHLVEEKVYRVVGTMLSAGFPITEFIGGRKNLDSTYTKLLSKREATASALYDKLRFRIVTRTREDLLPVLNYLTERVVPFNYVVPLQSSNTILDFAELCRQHPHLGQMAPHFQGDTDDMLSTGDNRFSAPSYRVIHFVADIPVRVPEHVMEQAPDGCEALGPIVFMLCEFQLLDADSDAANETGDASHESYKQRQRAAVFRRLRMGVRPEKSPGDADS